jgi:hypothetical protein
MRIALPRQFDMGSPRLAGPPQSSGESEAYGNSIRALLKKQKLPSCQKNSRPPAAAQKI